MISLIIYYNINIFLKSLKVFCAVDAKIMPDLGSIILFSISLWQTLQPEEMVPNRDRLRLVAPRIGTKPNASAVGNGSNPGPLALSCSTQRY